MNLHILLLTFLHALAPGDARAHDAPAILSAIETVVSQERAPVFGSREADALVLTATAHFESNMHLGAVGDHRQAYGAFQLHSRAGKGSPLTQAYAALEWLRRDRAVCPANPVAAFCGGNCKRGHKEGLRRMQAIQAALRRAKLAQHG